VPSFKGTIAYCRCYYSAVLKKPATTMEILSTTSVSAKGGILHRVQHESAATNTPMIVSIFLPFTYKTDPSAVIPAVYWLSGLTCTDLNFVQKASNAFVTADELGMAVIVPDTSPRGDNVADDEAYDLGKGAGFYVDATNAPWSEHYQMETYIKELVQLVETEWGVGTNCKSICGHSMGGHGALTLALKAPPNVWTSVSALAPICHPTACPWGKKAFEAYFGSVEAGKAHDATLLLQQQGKAGIYDDILIDEGTSDEFVAQGQLLLKEFEQAAATAGQKLTVRRQVGFDHSVRYSYVQSVSAVINSLCSANLSLV
jgi:S-formylglutathione hydrolase